MSDHSTSFFYFQRSIQVPAGGKADATDFSELAPVYNN